jgi:transcriptional antiterminator RfaH
MRWSWFLCKTKPRQESYAAQNVKRQGCRFFLPLYFDEAREAIMPLFPTYLFVQTTGQWIFLESTWGIVSVIKRGELPDKVPNKLIATLRKEKGRDGLVRVASKKFTVGQELRVKAGPFAELTGICQEMPEQRRITILLDILGRKVPVRLRDYEVEAAA